MVKVERNYKAYVAANRESKAFDNCKGKSAKSAIAALKKKYSSEKNDLFFWAEYLGQKLNRFEL